MQDLDYQNTHSQYKNKRRTRIYHKNRKKQVALQKFNNDPHSNLIDRFSEDYYEKYYNTLTNFNVQPTSDHIKFVKKLREKYFYGKEIEDQIYGLNKKYRSLNDSRKWLNFGPSFKKIINNKNGGLKLKYEENTPKWSYYKNRQRYRTKLSAFLKSEKLIEQIKNEEERRKNEKNKNDGPLTFFDRCYYVRNCDSWDWNYNYKIIGGGTSVTGFSQPWKRPIPRRFWRSTRKNTKRRRMARCRKCYRKNKWPDERIAAVKSLMNMLKAKNECYEAVKEQDLSKNLEKMSIHYDYSYFQ